jgi:hypothetical protein
MTNPPDAAVPTLEDLLHERARSRTVHDGFAVRVEPRARDAKRADAAGAFALAAGFYRFGQPTPGPWRVVRLAAELSPDHGSTESSGAVLRVGSRVRLQRPGGRTTRFDLATPTELAAEVDGVLLFDGAGPAGYVADLLSPSAVGGGRAERIASAPIRADGTLVLIGLAPPADAREGAPHELAGIPAVDGELVRFRLAELQGDADPRTAGTVLGRIAVPPGGTVDARLDE